MECRFRFPCLVDRIGLSSWSMLPRLGRCFALLMLLCMPFQALAALDGAVCAEQGYGDSGVAAADHFVAAAGDHEQIDLDRSTWVD